MTASLPIEVLLVDDDPGARKWIVALLRETASVQFEITRAQTLEAALECLAAGRTPVILVDAALPECGAPEVVRRLAEAAPAVPLLVLVDAESDCPVEECVRAGAQDCLLRATLTGPLLWHAVRFAIERKRWEEERFQVDAALHESEARFRTALEHAPIGMALVGIDGRWLTVNRALCRIVGYTEAELLGLTFQQITHPEDLDADLAEAQRLLDGEVSYYEMEKRYLHKQGRPVWILLTGSLVRAADGRPLYFVAQIQDITERKRSEDAARFLTEALQILASSLDYQETLRTVAQLAVPRLADWCVIELREGNEVRTVEATAADPIKEGILAEMRARYPTDPASLRHPLGRVLQSGRPTLWRTVRREMLEQLAQDERHLRMLQQLAPLSSMIVPLAARGRILGTVTLTSAESGRRYTAQDLAVAEDLAHAAALAIDNAASFRQAQERTEKREKVLAFAAFDPARPSAVPRGAEPTPPAVVPRSETAPAVEADGATRSLSTGEGSQSTLRLLVVDDHPLFRQGMVELLSRQPGMEVVGEAASGTSAVDLVGRLRPDLVIMDLMMPGMGGVEATQRITSQYQRTRVVLLSAKEPGSMVEAIEAGASAYLSKTAHPEKLIAALHAVMHGELVLDPATSGLPVFSPDSEAGDPLRELTDQERGVLAFAARGLTAAEISKKLFLSPKTVETYRSRAMRKLGLESRAELVTLALRTGLLEP